MSNIDHAVASPRPMGLDSLSEPAAYTHYRRLFASALARLAASGFAAPPDEGLDLIHGFFADLWSDVVPRHDPARAKFDTYIFGCFVNYARPRIVRFRRAHRLLADPALTERALANTPAADEHETEPLDLAAVRHAIGLLPALARSILRLYLEDDISERDVAAKFGLTRYAIRIQLSDAIGIVMVALGDLESLSDTDRSIARSLFRDRRTVLETAKLLQRDVAEIQRARSRWLGLLIHSVKGKRSMDIKRDTPLPEGKSAAAMAASLLVAALRPDAGEQADAAIREHREPIWQFLEGPEAERLLTPDAYADADPARLAQVYSLLADEANDAHAMEGDEYDAFLSIRENEERMIGEAFKVLISGLDGDAAKPWIYFRGLSEVDGDTFVQLRDEPSVRVANGLAIDMARYGITPVVIAKAGVSVSSLALRFCRQHEIGVGERLVLEGRSSADKAAGRPGLRRPDVIDNLALDIELPRSTLDRLYDWLFDAASFAPCFFEDFEAYGWEGELTLTRTDRPEPDVMKRWNASATAQASTYRYA